MLQGVEVEVGRGSPGTETEVGRGHHDTRGANVDERSRDRGW